MIHPTAEVTSRHIGTTSVVWQFAVILEGARIGEHCNINCHTFIENDVIIGDYVTVKSGVYLWDGLRVEDHVFIGPNATFVNDRFPRSKQFPAERPKTRLATGSSIGAGAVILDGLTIGAFAMVGAGAVVTRSVPDFAIVRGNPARICGWVDRSGQPMESLGGNRWSDRSGQIYTATSEGLSPTPV